MCIISTGGVLLDTTPVFAQQLGYENSRGKYNHALSNLSIITCPSFTTKHSTHFSYIPSFLSAVAIAAGRRVRRRHRRRQPGGVGGVSTTRYRAAGGAKTPVVSVAGNEALACGNDGDGGGSGGAFALAYFC
jgi:hypothetical protein